VRGLIDLLDDTIPVVPGCEIHDDPLDPQPRTVSALLRHMLQHLGFYRRMVIVDSVRRASAPRRSLPMQHFLNFLPEPHGHGSFLPT